MKKWVLLALCIGCVSPLALGDISNGNFSNGAVGWGVALIPGGNTALANQSILSEYSGIENVLRIQAINHYTWDDQDEEWYRDESLNSKVEVTQEVMAPLGTMGLQFCADASYSGADICGWMPSDMPTAVVTVTYMDTSGIVRNPYFVVDNQTFTCSNYIELPNLDAAQPVMLLVSVASGPLDPAEPAGTTTEVSVTGRFDNFAFAVPEPATIALLLAGTGVLLRRRRAA